jgi:hypothetical protein
MKRELLALPLRHAAGFWRVRNRAKRESIFVTAPGIRPLSRQTDK